MAANHEFILAGLRRWQMRRLRRVSIIVTILCVELLALTLLHLGCGAFQSLGIAAGVGAAYLAVPSLLALYVLIVIAGRTTIRALATRIRDKRTYQFSLKALLLAVVFASIPCAWYGHRVRRARTEHRILEGRWQRVHPDGKPIILPSGKPIIIEFARGNFISEFEQGTYTVNPAHNPKWLDFHTGYGTSRAIYRREGTRLCVMQVSAGVQRPTSFDQDPGDIALEPGVKIMTYATSTFFLERLPDQPETPTDIDIAPQVK